jgi:hypothetical protein
MAHTSCPRRGAIVTFLNPDVLAPAAFVRGVITGTSVVDPETGRLWVSVQRPDRTTLVLDAANITQVLPSHDTDVDPRPSS